MYQEIGTCSLCGGSVVGFSGAWFGVIPPPPARCTFCGAVQQTGPVIPMRPAGPSDAVQITTPGSTGPT